MVPDRPRKLRFDVRSDTAPDLGLWLLPMQKPQAFSISLAPEAMRSGEIAVAGEIFQNLP